MAIGGVNGINPISPSIFDKSNGVDNTNSISKTFGEYLNDALNKVNDLQMESQEIANDFAAGKIDNIHQVMIASEKADIALQFTMQIRNKILDAYNEIMRMQI